MVIMPQIIILFYIYIFLITELLSVFHLLYRPLVLGIDIIFVVVVMAIYRGHLVKGFHQLKKLIGYKQIKIIFVILTLTFIQGYMSAPSTTDAMVYHIPRVMYWQQEHTLYQDAIRNKHDFMAPFADYLLLHFYSITGSDRLVFLSQWLAYVVTIFISGLITIRLGGKKSTAINTALLTSLIPIAIMQSVSTQIDLVSTVLVLLSLYFAIILKEKVTLGLSLLFGFSVGLAFMAKAPSVFFLIPAFGILVNSLFVNKFKGFWYLAISALLALSIQLRYLVQNFKLFGNILGKHLTNIAGEELVLINEKINLSVVVSNLIKNIMIHLPIPIFSGYVQTVINKIHELIKLPLNSPITTCCQTQFKMQSIIFPQEDIVANPIHLLLIIFAGFFLLKKSVRKDKSKYIFIYILLIISIIAFSSIIKWQPFHPRFHIPIFVMGTIISVLILEKYKLGDMIIRMGTIGSIILGILLLGFNVSRPYISYSSIYNMVKRFSPPGVQMPISFLVKPRAEQYFNARPYWFIPYNQTIDNLNYTTDKDILALKLKDDFEYPIWKLMKEKGIKGKIVSEYQIEKANVIITTSDKPIDYKGFVSDCIKTVNDYGYICISKSP